MIRNLTEWDEDDKGDAEDEYAALRRSLSWTEGFGLLFVDCTPATAKKLIKDIRKDLPKKRIEVLRLTEPIENLYAEIAALPNLDSIDILFIQGLEHSIYDHEKAIKDNTERRNYSLFSVPRLLGHLNLQRESFRDHFNICFVFLLPKFALTYFNRRAPDFFDWRSGLFKLESQGELALAELSQGEDEFWFNQGYQQAMAGDLVDAIVCWEKALDIAPDSYSAWYARGLTLSELGRFEEAIASYDNALQFKPDKDEAWYNRGIALFNLGQLEEAIASYDKALQFKPDDSEAWYNRGIALDELGQLEEAIASFDKALQIKPDDYQTWDNRGVALSKLERLEEAIISFNKALEIKPDFANAFYNKACYLALQNQIDLALDNLQQAITLNPDECREMAKTDSELDNIRQYPRFQALIQGNTD
ncbi:tetratricopeptide repeat protein [Coleofasciculus sp.]|uniref:tetratricopeptide repeat protein n=1 Tax=Coleofasciculus sp. TaxID=3100458 RepID=UPI003A494B2F